MTPEELHIGVVGTGPVGLATADRLRRANYRVSLINSTQGSRRTFPAAAAFWTPFASGMSPADEQLRSKLTLSFYHEILGDPSNSSEDTGILNRQIEMRFLRDTCSHVPSWSSFPELKFERLSSKRRYSVFETGNFQSLKGKLPRDRAEVRPEFRYETPAIQAEKFIAWYHKRLIAVHGINEIEISFPFIGPTSPDYSECCGDWRKLVEENKIDHLVVCVGSNSVFDNLITQDYPTVDSFSPLKGVVAHLNVTPTKDCKIVLFEGGLFDTDTLYFVPLVDRYVLGGTVHAVGVKDHESYWQVSPEEKQGIIERAQCFLPEEYKKILVGSGLIDNPLDERIKWMAGVRPKLKNGPISIESIVLSDFISSPIGNTDTLVFLHYGHGGSGFTMCHDSADKFVKQLNERVL